MKRMMVVVLAALMLAACSKADPEVVANDQVPADQRTEAGAASEADGGEQGGAAATWVAVDIDFKEAPSEATAGGEITLVNEGAATHNVTIDGTTVVEAAGGETKSAPLDLEPGTYEFFCSVPGHESLMKGEVEVK